ncbi:MAG: carbohydrate ABC transporter permease [Clostridiales bacterium]|nr:carbohydrate ABC transporter permease [Clostridiales bacterium]
MAKEKVTTGMKVKDSTGYKVFTVFNTIIMILVCCATLYPFLYLIAQSFSSEAAIVAGEVNLIPKGFNVQTYVSIITDGKFIPYYWNTIVYTIIGTSCALFFSAILAYPLSKPELTANKVISPLIIFTMYFAGGMIPNYVLMNSLGLNNTVAAFILPGLISTYYVILMRSFFETVPKELEEAGEIDGMNKIGVFFRVALPLSMPIMATMALFYLVQYWNDWFDAFLYLQDTSKWPVAYYLRQLINSATSTSDPSAIGDSMQIAANIKSCAMVLTAAPIICVYPFIQKYFVQGMMLGGVKG